MGNEGIQFDLGGANAPAPVPLAHVPPFTLGPLHVEPAMRRISGGGGSAVQLEPLVMQVLIALVSAKGTTLTRDELIAAGWQGRVVTDDAINRVISKLRRTLDDLGGGQVRLETVPKVGYRLTAAPSGEEFAGVTNGAAPASPQRWRRAAFAAIGVLALGGVTALALELTPRNEAAGLTIGVEPVQSNIGDREASRFASDVSSDLARFAGAVSRITVTDGNLGDTRPDLIVRLAVERDAGSLSARARLVDTQDGSIIWSRTFRDDEGSVARLRDQTTVGLASVIGCGLERSAQAYDDPTARRLFFAACDAIESKDQGRAESFARQVVAHRPDLAAGWALLSMATMFREATPDDAARVQARRYAERALRLDPKSGLAFRALSVGLDPTEPRLFEILERGLRVDPESRILHSHYAIHMFNAGYVRASVLPAQRALALDPASLFAHGAAVRRFLAAGRVRDAMTVQATAERLWPNNPATIEDRVRLIPYWPDRDAALALYERVSPAPSLSALRQAELLWKIDPARIDIVAVENEAEAEFAATPAAAWQIAALMTRLGHHQRAIAWLSRAPRREPHSQWSLLFWPEIAPLRRDPRFFQAMAELGLVDLWLQRGQWPDFCSEPGLRYDCQVEAARLARKPAVA